VVVDYDNSMGYYIDYFFKDSEVQLWKLKIVNY
jgi:hypothetical protein